MMNDEFEVWRIHEKDVSHLFHVFSLTKVFELGKQ